jgi:putative FmdB family regulatory protein
MPIYEYKCEQCGHAMEAIQKFSDDPLTECPECGKPALKKQISASAFHLKGNGWYQTDFKDSGKKPEKKKESAAAPSCCAGGKCGTGH